MSQVSRPMQIALAATLLLAAVWFVALRPKSSNAGGAPAPAPAPAAQAPTASSSGAAPGVAGLKRAIAKAHGAVATANGDASRAASSSADGSAVASAPARPAAHAPTATAQAPARPRAIAKPTVRRRHGHGPVAAVTAALLAHKAIAIAFVDDGTADAHAVAQEMRHVSSFGGRAVVLSVPLSQLSAYAFITNTVQVTIAPTVVIVDRRGRASTIVGFADRGEIAQRLADALAVKPKR